MDLVNVNVGDKLLVSSKLGKHIEIVERITKTLVITSNHRFSVRDGVDNSKNCFFFTFAQPITDEEIVEWKRKEEEKKLRNDYICKCSKIVFKNLSTEKLKAILEIVEK